uniref:Uncharacterized protein n=1 Tax=Heliothis virescens TaxID=7102 RepID=A0A2A4JQW9_HELVI
MRVSTTVSKYFKSYNKLQRAPHHVTERAVRNNNNTDRKTKPSVCGIEDKAERKRRVGITGSSRSAQKYDGTNRNETKSGETGHDNVLLTRATRLKRVRLRCEKSVRFNKWFARAGDADQLGVPRAAPPASLRGARLCEPGPTPASASLSYLYRFYNEMAR